MSRKNVDNALMDALNAILPGKVFPNVYVGEAVEYIVTNYTTVPSVYGESGPAAARCLVMVHYYLPTGQNPNAKKLAIQQALAAEVLAACATDSAEDIYARCRGFLLDRLPDFESLRAFFAAG